ncbi:hypothetical protein DFH08DRAFT_870231 [Mycena albidolilacea]|uniref:Uncharacterized protein n=1 Tax=Mycena albidolilacea TaxID=1033008 RepID=A0AAD7A0F7_9AGAR|nr:hypothetical protein DFH08DRAFT_870231 [Mycena albidolilacea]
MSKSFQGVPGSSASRVAMSTLVDPQVKLHKLGEDVHIAYGDRARGSGNDPRVIILFGWMDAPLRILEKYAVSHRRRWPSSDIAIVQSHPAFIWSSQEKRDDAVRPLADYLVSTVYRQRRSVPNGILLHVISNGGAFQLITLSRLLKSILPAEPSDINHGTAIPMAAIFDSTPGTGEYASLLATLTTDVKSPLVKAILTVPGSLVYLASVFRRTVVGDEKIFPLLHRFLETQGLLPLAEGFAPRVYIYSSADKMVPFTSVENHLSILKANPSVSVAAEKFEGSQHVQHERQDPERYWNAVQAVWDRSLPIKTKL